jgi:Dolichyl-phosphate-mannose-protein mannosyltransferase
VTVFLRLAMHGRSFDLFGDEVIYTDLGRSVISGGFPRFEGPFFLHGPGFFYLEAGWARIEGYPVSLMGWIYEMRMLNCVLAGATAIVLVLLTARATRSPWAGAVAGALFAVEPFCIRQNDRVLLETAMMFWVMLGYLVFTSLIGRLPARHDWLRAVGAGLLFGFAVLTKDEGALLTILPLLAAAVLRWGPRLRMTMLTIATTVAVYAAYLAVVQKNGYFSVLWQGKTAGIQRMLGLVQSSGFNSSSGTGGSLSSRLIAEISYFGTTYTTLMLSGIAVLVVLFRGDQLQRMLGLVYCAAGVTLAYAVFLGTLEEQELYLLIIPSLVVIPVAATLLLSGSRRAQRPRPRSSAKKLWIATMGAALTIALGVNLLTCVRWLTQPDDGFARLDSYVMAHVPAGTAIGAVYADIETGYSLPGYKVGYWETKAAQAKAHVRYFVVEWGAVEQGYSNQTPAQIQHLVSGDRVVFSFTGRTYGNLVLYQLPG